MMILTEFLESGSLDNFLKVRFMTSMFIIPWIDVNSKGHRILKLRQKRRQNSFVCIQ